MEAWNSAAMDINAACSGFVYGLVVGTNMIRGGTHKTVVVIGTEKLHLRHGLHRSGDLCPLR